MCGRFALLEPLPKIAEEFQVSSYPENPLPISWNIKPTEDVYFITGDSIQIASWGLIASWSSNSKDAIRSQSQAINARSETVHEKPTFKNAFRRSRCLVPASGYYEWATELGKYKPRQPVYISRDDNKLLAFAGIYDQWISPEGEQKTSVAIVTRDAVGELATVHSRMPVFLPKDRHESWLDPKLQDIEQARKLFENFQPDKNLRFWTVSDSVNSIKNNGPELIAPVNAISETLF